MANKRKLENLAFPAISTGVYGYPAEEAAEVRVQSSRTLGVVSVGIEEHGSTVNICAWFSFIMQAFHVAAGQTSSTCL